MGIRMSIVKADEGVKCEDLLMDYQTAYAL